MPANNYDELFRMIEAKVQKEMLDKVAPKIQEEMRQKIYEVVYSVPESENYKRQMDSGGLSDYKNIKITPTENGFEIKDERMDGSINVSYNVEYGVGYSPYARSIYSDPRPFTQELYDDLLRTENHKEILKLALKQAGFDVR